MNTYDGEFNIRLIIWVAHFVSKVVDVLDPFLVRIETIGGKTNHFDATLFEFGVLASNFAEFCRADLGNDERGMWYDGIYPRFNMLWRYKIPHESPSHW